MYSQKETGSKTSGNKLYVCNYNNNDLYDHGGQCTSGQTTARDIS